RLGQRGALLLQGWNQRARVDGAIALLQLLAAMPDEMHRHRLVSESLQIERDAHTVRSGTAKVGVELHFAIPPDNEKQQRTLYKNPSHPIGRQQAAIVSRAS